MNRFEGKAALVTGAGVGIGYAICQALAREGALVALNDMNAAVAGDAAHKLNDELGRECVFPYVFDVANVEIVRQTVAAIDQRFGRLDVVVANAGITNYGSFLDYSPEAFDRITSVNLRGTYFTAQAGARAMIARKLPGALGSEESGVEESFSAELGRGLEYPHYTRPAEYRGWTVPDVLLSGDHARIASWRRERSAERSAA